MKTLRGKRILITGATGFIGNRLVERLVLEQGANVVALVHQFRNASRLARFPITMLRGDVTDSAFVRKAAEGCDAIVHAALATTGTIQQNRRVTVEGARNVCEAAKTVGARLVHFSTFSVYGATPPGVLNEDTPKNPGKDAYGISKLEAELIVEKYQQQGLSATILQPTVVYGPWATWSTYVAGLLDAGNVALPGSGEGMCNAVYIDDVIDAVSLCLIQDEAPRGSFLISGAKPVTWKQYFEAHCAKDSVAKVVAITEDELKSLLTQKGRAPLFPTEYRLKLRALFLETPGVKKIYASIPSVKPIYRILKKRFPIQNDREVNSRRKGNDEARIFPLRNNIPLMQSQSKVSIERAAKQLGFTPKFDLASGGKLTLEWLTWAGYGTQAN